MRAFVKTWMSVIATALLLVGCGKVPLHSKLTEQQANEIVAVLLAARIDADKELGEGGVWYVTTAKADLPRAVEVLHNVGYPRETFQTLGEVFKKEGFVSSPLEERARWIYGRQQELEQTLYSIDGVIKARVHLAIPERDPLSDKVRPSSASVFIKHQADVNFTNHVASIKAILVNSVEGLPYDNVTVSLFPARIWPVPVDASVRQDAPAPGGSFYGVPHWAIAAITVLVVLAVLGLLLRKRWPALFERLRRRSETRPAGALSR